MKKEKKYYIAERVTGVYFKDAMQIFKYFKRLVKHYYDGYNIGPIKEKSAEELKEYVKNHEVQTKWKESTI